jgi:putative 2OG-Fe(II) oxygenase
MNYTQTKDVLKKLNENGFSKIENFFTKEEINILRTETDLIINEDESITKKPLVEGKFKRYDIENTFKTAYKTYNRPIVGISKQIDDICERFFADRNIKNLLDLVLGKNYKVYTFGVRKANDYSNFVGLHQDGYNQFSFSILLNDIDKSHPATTFVAGSHKIPFKMNSKIESINVKYFKKLLTPAVGKAGDIFFLQQNISWNATRFKW